VKRKDLPRTTIIEAILRCERVGDPAVINRGAYAVHVRRLPTVDGRGWVIRIVDIADESEPLNESD
jgi:hypothetical protein